MRMLILGQGKTGRVVTEIARERGHSVQTLEERGEPECRFPHRSQPGIIRRNH